MALAAYLRVSHPHPACFLMPYDCNKGRNQRTLPSAAGRGLGQTMMMMMAAIMLGLARTRTMQRRCLHLAWALNSTLLTHQLTLLHLPPLKAAQD